MKKLLLSALSVFAFSFSNAQETEASEFGFSQGDIFVEGTMQFNSTNDKNTETKTNAFTFTPKAGYFLNDKFAAGLNLAIGSTKSETPGVADTKSSNFGVRAFGRYYFLDLGKRFKTYTEFGVAYNNREVSSEDSNGFGFDAGLGVNYFIKKNIAITYGFSNILSYTSEKTDGAKAESDFRFGLNNNSNFFGESQVGLMFIF